MRSSAQQGAPLARATKFLPLIWANLSRRPARTVLGVIAVTMAFTLYGLALGEAVGFGRAAAARHVDIGQGFLLGALAVSAIGMALILFLTANAMAQGVRLRIGEFGVLKALGFSHRLILALVMAEAALPCLAGAALGLVAAPLLLGLLKLLLPPLAIFPAPVYTPGLLAGAAVLAIVIGGISGGLPASRIILLEVTTALAGDLRATTSSRQEPRATRQDAAAATATTGDSRALRRVAKADLHLLRQILVVTRIGLSTLHLRLKGAAVIVVGVGAMAFVLLSFLSIAQGIHAMILESGDPARVLIRTANLGQAFQLGHSSVPATVETVSIAAPGVARGHSGLPLVESESMHGINPIKRNNGEQGQDVIAGVGPSWKDMMPAFRLLAGRLPRPGTREVMAGVLARRKFSGFDGGFADYKGQRWPIVGIFTTQDEWDGYLIGDGVMLRAASNRKVANIVRVRLTSPEAFVGFQHYVAARLPPGIMLERETDYYADFWRDVPNIVFYVAYLLGGLIGTGAFAGMVQTMQGAVEARAREIATLRALGFDGIAVAASVMWEAMLLAALGAFLGTALVWIWLDGFLYNALGVFRITVDFSLLLQATGWSLVIALPGALGPALRLARQTPIEALREV